MNRLILTAVISISFCLPVPAADTNPPAPSSFSIRALGAKGDGETKDTAAIQKTLDACAAAGGGTVIVPAGNYLIGSIIIGANTTLQFERNANFSGSPDIADYPLVKIRWEGEFTNGHRALISAENAGNISIRGPGAIFGPPLSISRLRNPRGPTLLEFTSCTNVLLENFSTLYQQLWNIHPLYCRNFTARNLIIRSINSNSDGIDVDSCNGVLIEHCDINTGDDSIALKSGRGMSAVNDGRPTENVIIKDCTLAASIFAGLAVGSEISGGIRDVRVENCRISGRQNAIYIKSRDGRGGFMENITGENLTINDSPTFLGIDLLKKGIQASDPVPGETEKWSRVSNIVFHNIRVSNVAALVEAGNIPPQRPLNGLILADIQGTCQKGISLANMTNVNLSVINVTGLQGSLLTTKNVQGVGLENPSAVR